MDRRLKKCNDYFLFLVVFEVVVDRQTKRKRQKMSSDYIKMANNTDDQRETDVFDNSKTDAVLKAQQDNANSEPYVGGLSFSSITDAFTSPTVVQVHRNTTPAEAQVASLSSMVHNMNAKIDSSMPDPVKVVLAMFTVGFVIGGSISLSSKYSLQDPLSEYEPMDKILLGLTVVSVMMSIVLIFYANKDFTNDDNKDE